jgi:DNA-binding response OmpR family regulator
MHILLIEDDLDLGRALHRALAANDFSCEWLRRISDVPQPFDGVSYDCVLLDLSLPDGTGLDLLARWRREDIGVPVIVITARSTLEDRLAGLNGGADDFVVKPFAVAELMARIHAVSRRYARQSGDVWAFGGLEIEPRRHRVRLDGAPLELSPREFCLLLELVREPGAVVSKGTLAQKMEPLGDAVDFGVVEVHMHNLRRKIGAERVKTVRGVGYMLAA